MLLPDPAQAGLLAAEVDAFLATDDVAVAEQLPVALLVLEHSAAVRGFHRLPIARRQAVLEGWERSRLVLRRQIFQALRRTAVMSFFAHPSNWAAMGYDGPLVGR